MMEKREADIPKSFKRRLNVFKMHIGEANSPMKYGEIIPVLSIRQYVSGGDKNEKINGLFTDMYYGFSICCLH